MDLLIYHNRKKYIVETKIWEGDSRYQAGKKQLAAYLKNWKAQRKDTISYLTIVKSQSLA